MILLAIFITLCFIKESTNTGGNCTWSRRTVQEVSTCPVTTADKEKAEKIKKCHELAEKQNCTEASMFKYHCVINENNDKFLEVCAPAIEIILGLFLTCGRLRHSKTRKGKHGCNKKYWRFFYSQQWKITNENGVVIQPSTGHCVTYNVTEARIESHKNKTCNRGGFPCPQSYLSSDAYKFPSCYGFPDNVSTYETTTNIDDSCSCPTNEEYDLRYLLILIWASISTVLISISFLIVLTLYNRMRNGLFTENSGRSETDQLSQLSNMNTDSLNEEVHFRKRVNKTKKKDSQTSGKNEFGSNAREEGAQEYIQLFPKQNSAITLTDTYSINHIACISGEIAWLSNRKKVMKINLKGRILDTYIIDDTRASASHTVDVNGDLFFIKDNDIHRVSSDGMTKTFLTPAWNVLSIYSSHISDDLILGTYIIDENHFKAKLLKYSKNRELLQSIQYHQGKSLYSFPLFISENTNRDICTTDIEKCVVTVVDGSGVFRFRYYGHSTEKGFFPTGICNNIYGQIIVCNRHYANPSVHLLSSNGDIALIILTKNANGINDPYGVYADDEGNLYLGQHGSNTVMVYRYLQ